MNDNSRADTFTTLASMHKISDAVDLRHPIIERILRQNLGYPLVISSQRAWEFAMVYATLEMAGLLDGTKVGVSFGAGFERILYALSRRVAKLHATDLYAADSIWEEAQTSDVRAELVSRAEIPWEPSKVSITHMDMRHLTLPDRSVDFAYSISAIEHIGEDSDFLAHLREARRVLKPDGIYVLTTTLVLLPATIRQRGCFLFAEPHLRNMIHEAGFSTPGPLDLRMSDDLGNIPCFKLDSLELPPAIAEFFVPRINVLYRDEPYAACCLVLRSNEDARHTAVDPATVELTRATIIRLRDRYVKKLWSRPVRVEPRCYKDFLRTHPSYFAFTEAFWFGERTVEWELTIGSIRSNWSGRVLIFLQSAPTDRPELIAHDHHREASIFLARGQVERIVLRCKLASERGYSLVGRVEDGDGMPDSVTVTVRVVDRDPEDEVD